MVPTCPRRRLYSGRSTVKATTSNSFGSFISTPQSGVLALIVQWVQTVVTYLADINHSAVSIWDVHPWRSLHRRSIGYRFVRYWASYPRQSITLCVIRAFIPFAYTTGATKNFRTANVSSTQFYDFFYDYGTYIVSRNLGFWDSSNVFSGGEVVSGIESMGNVLHANNKYLTWIYGQWVYVPYSDNPNPLIVQKDITYNAQIVDGNNWRITGP
jgi:hypothetical protein